MQAKHFDVVSGMAVKPFRPRKTYMDEEEIVFISVLSFQLPYQSVSREKLPIKSYPTFRSHTTHQQHQLWWSKHSNYIDANQLRADWLIRLI